MPDSTPRPDELDALFERVQRRRRWPWLLLLVLAIGAVTLWAAPRGPEPPRFATVPLAQRDLVATVSATGQLQPVHQVLVGSEISGTITEVLVDANDVVEAGQVLARIDTTKLTQQIARSRAASASARAQQAQAEASHAEAEAQLQRFEEVSRLSDGQVPSQTEFDAARASAQRARAGIAMAEAAVAEAEAATRTQETDLAKSVIRAPIDGIVLDRSIDPGQTVAASFQAPVLFTLGQDLRTMKLTVNVAEADIGKVVEGQTATFTVDAWPNQTFAATVARVSFGSKTIENVVSYETELAVPNDAAKLRPGMTATAMITVDARRDVRTVPNAALRFTPPQMAQPEGRSRGFSFLPRPPGTAAPTRARAEGTAIYVLRQEALVRVPVETGLSDGRWTEIEDGDLQNGDAVVVDRLADAS
ncbi:MAG: efflux RND transporter periplasmic adaptor subunit [Acidobacteriota bacterium]